MKSDTEKDFDFWRGFLLGATSATLFIGFLSGIILIILSSQAK